MVTAEVALVVPSVLFLTACGWWGLVGMAAQLRCDGAAAAGAAAAGSGARPATVHAVAAADAPPAATVTVSAGGHLVRVTVRFAAHPPGGLLRLLPELQVSATDVAYRAG